MSPEELTKGELTRAAIVEAAHQLFITQGYHGTSMRQIATNAGIALGGIYNHFSSKEDIFREVFIDNHPFLEMIPALETAQGDTVEEFVRDSAVKMLAAVKRKPDFLNLRFIELVEFKSAHVHEIFQTTLARGLQIVQRMAAAEGDLRPIPPNMLIRAFIGLFFSYHLADIILSEVAPPEFSDNAIDYQIDIFLHGILGNE